MDRKALITGITGQDSAYLTKFLLGKGYIVYGTVRNSASDTKWRLKRLGIDYNIFYQHMDLLDPESIKKAIDVSEPDEIYHLAAQSFVGSSWDIPIYTAQTNAMGTLNLLDIVRRSGRCIRIFNAATSEMFGKVQETPQKETTPFYPRSPYGFSKVMAYWACVNYREAHNMFVCNGITFNHESPLRTGHFVTKKITDKISKLRLQHYHTHIYDPLILGNLDSRRDWGYAGDYVEAFWKMLQHPIPGDYVIATGETHSVREFVEESCRIAGLGKVSWEDTGVDEKGFVGCFKEPLIEVSAEFFRPTEVDLLVGDAEKAKIILGWEPKVKFHDLVKLMMEAT